MIAMPMPEAALARIGTRNPALDIAKGVAIILVVLGHSILGVQGALGSTPPGRFAVLMIYTVHMPLFFFVAGVLARSAMTEALGKFARRVSLRVIYPYLLWSLVLLVAHYLMRGHTNTRLEAFDPIPILYRPSSVMWFLYVLLFCLLAARFLRGAAPASRLAVGVVLVVAGYLSRTWALDCLRFIGIFLIGTALSPDRALRAVADWRLLALGAAGLAVAAVCAGRGAGTPLAGYPAGELRYLPGAFGGIVLILGAAQALGRAAGPGPGEALAFIGMRTMPIFVTHILVVVAVRLALLHLGFDRQAAIVATATLCGVALPLLAHTLAERLGLARLLGWA